MTVLDPNAPAEARRSRSIGPEVGQLGGKL